ncbi:HWE histidine kinase domain-containing protein [Methylobacterium sp. NEAU 140]|uniref:sensor histidine kinase n=1 Tax=Methylobacterium sp. NEAU 140 TaxID=3064945 RepID=UPI0027328CF6|nr:HWE histidine kinase domain-containing protein [Methylobacterium sp. NEAU 140]MDP4026960.1 HWE histidine kinase domain-containing protein [Methylobacterium sp. NEAU 140]
MPNSRQPLQSTSAASAPLVSLRRGAGQLFETERRLNAVLDNASVSIFLMDDRQHCIYMNRAAELLTGWTLAEVLGRDCPLHDIVHHTYPDGRPFPLEECAIDRAFPENNQERGEEVFIHRDGHFFPVGFTASPIRDDAANIIGTIIEVRDISEEKAAAERQRLLINELNHRVKNTLATVQSIAAQTFRGQTDQAARAVFDARMAALSNAHNVLVEDNWESASLRSVIGCALAPHLLAEVDINRFQLRGPDARLHPKVAVTLAMALHELMTNAAKYGALSVSEGQVAVTWSLHGMDDRRQQLDLCWEERGGPAVSPPTRKGFGSRLIERQLPMEFDGSAVITYAPEGVVCRLEVPLTQLGWVGQEAIEGRQAR